MSRCTEMQFSISYRLRTAGRHVMTTIQICSKLLAGLSLLIAIEAIAADPAPSKNLVQQWWKLHSSEEMSLDGDLIPIGLADRERAYLVEATMPSRGRNFMSVAVLVRPKLRE